MPRRTSALSALTADEKVTLLDQLLVARPGLRDLAEALAAQRLSSDDTAGVADDVEHALCLPDVDELNGRAGSHLGVGYVDPGEAADEILDEALRPFLDDLERRAKLGMTDPASTLAVAIIDGLYRCRDGSADLLEYSPDYPAERAASVVRRCGELGVGLPMDEFLDRFPQWGTLLSLEPVSGPYSRRSRR